MWSQTAALALPLVHATALQPDPREAGLSYRVLVRAASAGLGLTLSPGGDLILSVTTLGLSCCGFQHFQDTWSSQPGSWGPYL